MKYHLTSYLKKKEKKRKENLPHIELAEQRSALKAMIRVLKGNI